MRQDQPGYKYNYGYNYNDYAAYWEDNYPARISAKQCKDHVQTAQDACKSAQKNGKEIGEVKSVISDARGTPKYLSRRHARPMWAKVRELPEEQTKTHQEVRKRQEEAKKREDVRRVEQMSDSEGYFERLS
ncbi:hypothetical protein F5Y07DRAFT_396037 [Xylaria sp. FL0933]|nr:hypothetical protein F5Y07DRAFT_396037 [Xylaria sp. FL0933]